MLQEQYLRQQERIAGYVRWVGGLATAGALIALHPTLIGRMLFRVWAIAASIPILWLIYVVLVTTIRRAAAHLRSERLRRYWHFTNAPWR